MLPTIKPGLPTWGRSNSGPHERQVGRLHERPTSRSQHFRCGERSHIYHRAGSQRPAFVQASAGATNRNGRHATRRNPARRLALPFSGTQLAEQPVAILGNGGLHAGRLGQISEHRAAAPDSIGGREHVELEQRPASTRSPLHIIARVQRTLIAAAITIPSCS